MNLDQVTLEIRPRNAWEAMDLGLLMARRWWLPMMKLWLITSFPVLLIALLIPTEKWWISAILLWWLKPVYERPLLHIISRAVFNDLPNTRSTLKQFPSLLLKQIFLSLTWRRISPTRSMDLPVLQLEGLTGKRRQERLTILHREDSTPAGWISVIGLFLELSLWGGLISLIWVFIPRELNIEWAGVFFNSESAELTGLQIVLWYVALGLSAPFYVACGFALYLNRRIKLEAWDIDIAFRRITNKRIGNTALSAISALLLGLCLSIVDISKPAHADDNLPGMEQQTDKDFTDTVIDPPIGDYQELNRDTAQEAIQQVVQQSEFSRKEIRRSIKWEEPDEDSVKFWEDFFKSLENFEGFLAAASLLEIMLWLGAIALIALLLYRYRAWLAAQFVRIKPQPVLREKPVTLFGMDVTRESLPENISQSALALLSAGNHREALALLYRASLFELIQMGVEIHDGHTEGECVQLMREQVSTHLVKPIHSNESSLDYFSRLTRAWQQLAYGHVLPDKSTAEQLCNNWNNSWKKVSASSQGGAR